MRVVLGVGGGIAAYKAAELSRLLIDGGASVQVVLTEAGRQFVTPLTLATLTQQKVITDLFANRSADEVLASSVEHIQVAQNSDVLVVAPATAGLLAKFAQGLADDFLSTLYLAFDKPVVLAPAMNSVMWCHAATRANVETLRQRGHIVIEPAEGFLACGMTGPGRLAEPQEIATRVLRAAERRRDLEGETIVITAGPTQEPLDPVRFVSNRSSGKMGYALAEAAMARGARVVLISGPVHVAPPPGVELVRVRTALEMRQAVLANMESATIVIKSAAVADYHLEAVPKQKVKKTPMRLSLDLAPTPDILAEVGRSKGERLLVGFAAETSNLVAEARRKLETKNCDMVVGNLVNQEGTGFESDENEVVLVGRDGSEVRLGRAPKRDIAQRIFDALIHLRLALHSAAV